MSKKLIVFLGNDYDKPDHEDLFPEIERLGADVKRIHPDDIVTEFKESKTIFYHNDSELSPDLVVGWVYEDILYKGMYLLETFERNDIPVINKARVLFCAQNKYLNSAMLHAADIPHLPVLSGKNKDFLLKKAHAINFPMVCKPVVGFGGNGVMKFDTKDQLEDYLSNHSEEYYVQPFVRNPGRDIRVSCVNYKAIVAFYRYAPKDGWITNAVAGGTPVITQLTSKMAKVAEDASKALGTRISGVDIVEDLDAEVFRVFEVNSCPSVQPPFNIMKRKPIFLYELADFLVNAAHDYDTMLATWRPTTVHIS